MKKVVLIIGIICLIFSNDIWKKVSVVYSVKNRKAVKVVPVSNINMGNINYMEAGTYGVVTSCVSQNVELEFDYKIEDIFVKKGESVKEGQPLFSYDMTLEELKLEIARLKQQAEEINLQRMEKELKKMGGSMTAQLTPNNVSKTTAPNDVDVICTEDKENVSEISKLTAFPEETSIESTKGSSTGMPTEVPIEAASEKITEVSTEAAPEKLTEAPSEAPTEVETEKLTEAPSEAPTEVETEKLTEAPSEPPEEPSTESPIEIETEIMTEQIEETEKESMLDEETISKIVKFKELLIIISREDELSLEQLMKNIQEAIDIYQKWLSKPKTQEDILIEDQIAYDKRFDIYELSPDIKEYFIMKNNEEMIYKLTDGYKAICIQYVLKNTMSLQLDTMTEKEVEHTMGLYEQLGNEWQSEIELLWYEKNKDSDDLGKDIPTMIDTLRAYDITLKIREFSPNTYEEDIVNYLTALRDYYLALPKEAQDLVNNSEEFIAFLQKYNLWEENMMNDSEIGYTDWDDGIWPEYTEEERKEMIKEKEREIITQRLEVREATLETRVQQAIVDKKVVKSKMDGIVVSIGELNGSSEDDYFARIANTKGQYVKGVLDEFSREKLKVGDTIQGNSFDTGIMFSAIIKEISEYPENGNTSDYFWFGMENGNNSYYPFYALIEGEEEMEEGQVQINLSETDLQSDVISLEQYFIRDDQNGKKYVMKRGENDTLCKQYVKIGITNGTMVEILGGLTLDDWIAFPYGNNVKEGTPIVETDSIYE